MRHINYYCLAWGSSSSGGGIFDAKLMSALNAEAAVRERAVRTFRQWTLPVWTKRLDPVSQPDTGNINVVSHEFLHEIVDTHQVDCFIIHNYFSEFDFEKLRVINPLYRFGSDAIYAKIFAASGRVVFLSAREMRLAAEKHPEYAEKFSFCPPGHNDRSAYSKSDRNPNIVEMPGTVDWLPKKVSYWLNVPSGLPVDGKLVHGDSADAYISIVFDSFLSGFKLKLVEIAKHAKSIISFCDLQEDLSSIGFGDLPYLPVRNRSDLGKAITFFRDQGDLSPKVREELFLRAGTLTWGSMAKAVLGE
jgi:hypothetical protein